MRTISPSSTFHLQRTIAVAAAGCALVVSACGSSITSPGAAADNHATGLEFADCIRSHGVPSFPDPEAGAGVQIPLGFLDQRSPAFRSAMHACERLIPTGAPPVVSAGQQVAALKFAQCMRVHGVPGFPDPVYRDGHANPIAVSDNNPDSPAFRHAANACRR